MNPPDLCWKWGDFNFAGSHFKDSRRGDFSFPGMVACKVEVPHFKHKSRGFTLA